MRERTNTQTAPTRTDSALQTSGSIVQTMTTMLLQALVCAVLTSTGFANITASNDMMDNILKELRTQTVRFGVDPSIVHPFAVKVKADESTKQDVKANFTQASLHGLGDLKRQGNCSYGPAGSELGMGCSVSLAPLRFLMDAEVEGDKINGTLHSIAASSQVSANSSLLIELLGGQNQPARLGPLTLSPVTITTSLFQGRVDLDGDSFDDFLEQINDHLRILLAEILTGRYAAVLQKVANRFEMP